MMIQKDLTPSQEAKQKEYQKCFEIDKMRITRTGVLIITLKENSNGTIEVAIINRRGVETVSRYKDGQLVGA